MIKIQKRVSEYLILKEVKSAELMDRVNDRLKEGWDIVGGMATIQWEARMGDGTYTNETRFYQTMVKYEEDYYDTSALIDFMENKK